MIKPGNIIAEEILRMREGRYWMTYPNAYWYPGPIKFKEDPMTTEHDPVNKPKHYTDSAIETIDAIEAWGLGYHLGNCVKYISRAGKKDPAKTLEDLRKAQWYLNRYIAKLEGTK